MNREEAIEVVRKNWPDNNYSMLREALQTLIPELAESEDERIRKALIHLISEQDGILTAINGINVKDILAYLEKQKARGPLTKEEEYTLSRIIEQLEDEGCPQSWKDLLYDIYNLPYEKASEEDERIRNYIQNELVCLRASEGKGSDRYNELSSAIVYLEKQKEQPKEKLGKYSEEENLAYRLNWVMQDYIKAGEDEEEQERRLKCYKLFWDAVEDTTFFEQKERKSVENMSQEEYVKRFKALCDAYEIKLPRRKYDIYHLCNDLSKLSIDSGKQKLAEWSEDFDKEVESVHKRYPEVSFAKLTRIAYHFAKWADKYKSTEWSEEDKEMINLLIAIFEVNYPNGFYKANPINTTNMSGVHSSEIISWLRLLRPQPQYVYQQTVECLRAMCDSYENNGLFTDERARDFLGNVRAKCKDAIECAPILDEHSWKPSEEELIALKRVGGVLRDNGHNELAKTIFIIEGKLANLPVINESIWKPSKEQMNALADAITRDVFPKGNIEHLESLYNDLKKL